MFAFKAKKLAIAAAAGLLSVGTFAIANPADAAPPGCGFGYACMWRDINYYTGNSQLSSFNFRLFVKNLGDGTRNYPNGFGTVYHTVSSDYNNGTGGEVVYSYPLINCAGVPFSNAAGSGDMNYANGTPPNGPGPGGTWNDAVGSVAFATQAVACKR